MLIDFFKGLAVLVVIVCTFGLIVAGIIWVLVGTNDIAARLAEGCFLGLIISVVIGAVMVGIEEG